MALRRQVGEVKQRGLPMQTKQLDDSQSKGLLPSVSTSLALAATIGIAEAVAHFLASGLLMNAVGISADSPMRTPAENLLVPRAFGAPPIVIVLAAQGPFRGFKDTKTPLYAIVAGNLLNAILMFTFFFGIRGAAIATVISEYVNDVAPDAAILMWKLNSKVLLVATYIDGRRIIGYRKSGGLPIGRSLAVVVTTTLATSMAEGPGPMAGHQIWFQV
ncbi:protein DETOXIFICATION 44, chloroplastic-like [Malus domestica]|uniref:protein DETOXIFICATION 44, chloroplastic-like n=1 Tax=Malus domestica TaxID=3750 RepID=UPI0039752CDF